MKTKIRKKQKIPKKKKRNKKIKYCAYYYTRREYMHNIFFTSCNFSTIYYANDIIRTGKNYLIFNGNYNYYPLSIF